MNPYEILGCTPDDDFETIKQAFRRAASKAHPDREGGSHEAASKVNEAWAILQDAERKANYDLNGDGSAVQSPEAAAKRQMVAMFAQVIGLGVHGDVIQQTRKLVNENISNQRYQQGPMIGRKAEIAKVIKKIKVKDGENLLVGALEQQIRELDQRLTLSNAAIVQLDEVLVQLAAYEFVDDSPKYGGIKTPVFISYDSELGTPGDLNRAAASFWAGK